MKMRTQHTKNYETQQSTEGEVYCNKYLQLKEERSQLYPSRNWKKKNKLNPKLQKEGIKIRAEIK